METGMLNPFHNEEGQFGIDRDPQENSPWGSDHDVHESHLPSSDGKEEDFRRTLHDWRRHVDAFPMPDTVDYIPNEMLPADIFEQTPSPSKTKEFCFMPQNQNNSMNDITSPQSTLPKGGYSYTINQTHHSYTSQLRGDNRLMDNDNTSFKQENFTCSTEDEDSDISECDPGMGILSNGYQIIPVNPDLDLSSDSSVKSNSRSSTPDNYSSSDSQCPDLQRALQKSIVGEVNVNNIEKNSPECNGKETFPARSVSNIMEYCIQKTPENIRFNKMFALNSPGQYKRQNKKSMSLPQSPKHVPHTPSELDGLDLHTSLSFEDMKLDFSEFVNVSPNSSFAKKFDICEVFDTPAAPFSDRSFVPKRELKPTDLGVSKISVDDKSRTIHPNANDILSIIEKTAMGEHELNTSDILFPCRIDDLEVGDMNNFDLPSFIMDDLHVDSTGLLKDSPECSPIISKSTKYCTKIENLTDFNHVTDATGEKQPNIVVSTPKEKTEMFCTMDDSYQHYQNGESQGLETTLTMDNQKSYPMEKITCNGEVISMVASTGVIANAFVADSSKGDTEDYVDVETIDEGDSLTVLAASNVNSLWEQFEATEDLDIRNRPSTGSLVNSHSPNTFDKATEALSVQDKSQLATLDGKKSLPWSLPIRPYMVIPGMSKNKWQDSPTKQQSKPEIVSPILLVKDRSGSLHNTSNTSVHLDHDYCSPVRIKNENQSALSNGHDESETDDPKDSHFVSPNRQDVTNLSSVYKMLNASKQKLGLGKGKSISMCISNADEFTENVDDPISLIKPPKSSHHSAKNIKLTPFKSDSSLQSRYSDMSDSDCSMSDHSYSKADFNKRLPDCKSLDIANGKDFDDNHTSFKKNSVVVSKDQNHETLKSNICDKKRNFEETNSRNAQNLMVLKNGSERLTEMNKTSNSLLNKNTVFTKGNKNSLLINNINKNYNGKESVIRKLILNANDKVHTIRQKQSLLKPAVRNEIKMVSLLKSNNVDKTVLINESEKIIVPSESVTMYKATENDRNTISVESYKDIELELPSSVIAVNKVFINTEQSVVMENTENLQQNVVEKTDKKLPLKRKLNLEEYKKRRGNSTRSCESSRTCSPVICAPDTFAFSSPNSPAPVAETVVKPVKLSEPPPSLTEMLQNVLCNSKHPQKHTDAPVAPVEVKEEETKVKIAHSDKKIFNPIADASKKALQLKKLAAQRSKDSKIILNKIPKVTNDLILPMATENGKILPMTKNVDDVETELVSTAPIRRKNSDYEEIIMFSVGVNTNPVIIIDEANEKDVEVLENQAADKSDALKPSIQFKIKQNKTKMVMQKNVFEAGSKEYVSLSPDQTVDKTSCVEVVAHAEPQKKVSKDVAKANKIDKDLQSINATLEKVERRKDLKITSNSLIASIQDVVHKKNSKNSASRSPDDVNDSSNHKTSSVGAGKLVIKNKEVDKKIVISKIKKSDDRNVADSVKDILDVQNIKKSPSDLGKDGIDVQVIKEGLKDCPDATEDIKCIGILKSEHGEDKVIMHLKKDRVRPDMCTLAIQTDFKILIKDIVPEDLEEEVIKHEDVIDLHDNSVVLDMSVDSIKKPNDKKDIKSESKNDVKSEKEKTVEYAKKIQPDRSYRRRKDSLSSEASTENFDVTNRRKDRRLSRDRYDNPRKTNSRERHHRTSRSPMSSRRSANRSRSWGRYNRYNNRVNRRRDSHYTSRRSRSVSRDRRKRNNSRDWKSYRPYTSARNSNRDRSRSSRNDRDDRSVRSVNSISSKRKRLVSRSSLERPTGRSHVTKKSAREPERTSISLDRADYSLHERETQKSSDSVFVASGEERNGSIPKENTHLGNKPNRSRRRKSTECSNASYVSQRTKSSSRYSSGSEDDSSSSSSSSSDSSSDSDSSDSNSDREFNSADTKKLPAPSNRQKSELVEERRQVFVGRLESDLTKSEFRMKFVKYGQVTEVTTHKKDDGSRYGFVTFGQAEQAYRVVERANSDPDLKRYDISFGGRRQFCRQFYSDLDDLEAVEDTEYFMAMAPRPMAVSVPDVSFDFLLEEMKAALAKKGKDTNSRSQTGQGPRSGQPRAESHCKV